METKIWCKLVYNYLRKITDELMFGSLETDIM